MKKYAYNEITTMQYIFLIFTTEIGIGVLPIPTNIVQHVGTDAWISVILAWALVSVSSLVIIQVMKRYPEGTLLDLLSNRHRTLLRLFRLCHFCSDYSLYQGLAVAANPGYRHCHFAYNSYLAARPQRTTSTGPVRGTRGVYVMLDACCISVCA
jgi:hypothetical protein